MEAIRRWPLPSFYASVFAAREYGKTAAPVTTPFRGTNHETQQSPLYYWAAGLLLRLVPQQGPLEELYLLRFINGALAFFVGVLIWKAAKPTPLAWVPVMLLAVIPGFGIAMCRVANDALCAALISVAVAGTLSAGTGGWLATAGSLAAGAAPWAKLYGLAILPGSAVREALRKGAKTGSRMLRLLLALILPLVLVFCSWRLTGHLFPVMYNVRHEPFASVFEVPWLQDAWLVVKSHIWMSGMSFLVFPTWFYAVPVLLLGWGIFLTLSRIQAPDREVLTVLGASVAVFVAALAYHDWRSFSSYHGTGGTGGWYLWAIAFPEMLLLTAGARRRGMLREWAVPTLAVFTLLTILADAALFLDSTGRLIKTSRGHVVGFARAPAEQIASAYLQSRPAVIAIAAVISAISSWLLAAYIVSKACGLRTQERSLPSVSLAARSRACCGSRAREAGSR